MVLGIPLHICFFTSNSTFLCLGDKVPNLVGDLSRLCSTLGPTGGSWTGVQGHEPGVGTLCKEKLGRDGWSLCRHIQRAPGYARIADTVRKLRGKTKVDYLDAQESWPQKCVLKYLGGIHLSDVVSTCIYPPYTNIYDHL